MRKQYIVIDNKPQGFTRLLWINDTALVARIMVSTNVFKKLVSKRAP